MDNLLIAKSLIKMANELVEENRIASDDEYVRVEYRDDNLKVTLEEEDDGRFEVTIHEGVPSIEWKEMEEYYFDTLEEAHDKVDDAMMNF